MAGVPFVGVPFAVSSGLWAEWVVVVGLVPGIVVLSLGFWSP
jgi:hypothetical protein